MSIMQEYEQIRKQIGEKKYDAIDKYLNEICPKEIYEKYNQEVNSLIDLPSEEWLKRKKELEGKYGIIFLSDVLYNSEEWNKFEKWYNENNERIKKHKEREAR